MYSDNLRTPDLLDWVPTQQIPHLELTQEELVSRVGEHDRRLVQLLDMRLDAGLSADASKDVLGMSVLAPQREMQVLDRVREENERQGAPLVDPVDLVSFYTHIMRATRTQQLLARKARGSITRDEQHILNNVTGTNDSLDGLPTVTRKQVEGDSEQEALEQLAESRDKINALDIAIIHRLGWRQQDVVALDIPVYASSVQNVVYEERNRIASRLDGVDMVRLFDRIVMSMRSRQLDAIAARKSRARASVGYGATQTTIEL